MVPQWHDGREAQLKWESPERTTAVSGEAVDEVPADYERWRPTLALASGVIIVEEPRAAYQHQLAGLSTALCIYK